MNKPTEPSCPCNDVKNIRSLLCIGVFTAR
jgi:hypothetical protein